ncbi:MAG: hypothetical protein C0501_26125 [Isosphaera sp.]|nr:hypothetical protein [Isosphaera sp.]
MSERVFCIDFGSAFTKVGLRRDPTAASDLVNNPVRRADELDFCIPSVAWVNRAVNPARVEFGPATANYTRGGGLEPHSNWKRYIFSGVRPSGELAQPPLDQLLGSPQLATLAAGFGVTPGQVAHLRELVAQARGLLGVAAGVPADREAGWRTFAQKLAHHFFRWLRGYVMEACAPLRSAGLNPEAIPVRVSVPAFAHGRGVDAHPGCGVLTDALARAGWVLHPTRPVISEPLSNLIGVLTEGRNVLSPKRRVQLRSMFQNGPIIRPLADPEHYPAYRAWCVDIGAFTTDFTALTLDPGGRMVAEPEEAMTVRQHSVPLGVRNLDEMVLEALPPEQSGWLKDTARPIDWEDFRAAAYTRLQPFRTAQAGRIGGPALEPVVRDFAGRVAAECDRFRADLPPVKLQELVLTGGGNCIPEVSRRVAETMTAGAGEFCHVYWPLPGGDGVRRRLGGNFPRGGTALGGTSVFFEPAYA